MSLRQTFCNPYMDKRTGQPVEGCGKQVKWEQEQTQYGLKNRKKNMDGSKHICEGGNKMPGRTEDMMPAEYQQLTSPTQAVQGHADAKSSSMLEQFVDQKSDAFFDRIEERMTNLIDNSQTKSTSNNVSVATIGKTLDDMKKTSEDRYDLVMKKIDDVRMLAEALSEVLKDKSFQGADKLYEKEIEKFQGNEEIEHSF